MSNESGVFEVITSPASTWDGLYPRDVVVLFSVPVVLCAVFTLPLEARQSLVFDYTDPSILNAYAAPFVHLDAAHLTVNVLGYALVVPAAYLLSVASGRRRRFFVAFGTFLLAFPILLSYLNLAVLRPTIGLGFSGVVMAFVGYLPLALADYLDERVGIGPSESLAPVFFFLGIALVAGLSVQSVQRERATVFLGTGGLVLASLLSALLYWFSSPDRAREALQKIRSRADVPGHVELVGFTGVVFVGFFFVAFPPEPTDGTTIVNVYVHMLGYALGFISTYATVVTGARLPGPNTSV